LDLLNSLESGCQDDQRIIHAPGEIPVPLIVSYKMLAEFRTN